MQQGGIRGRPAGRMTLAKRKVLAFVVVRQARGESYTLGQVMRVCGFSCRSNAKRTLRALREMGLI